MKRWLFTALSFAVVIGVSVYAVRSSAPDGVALTIPPVAHLLALAAFVIEVVARSLKMSWSARAVGTSLPFLTAVRTSLGGDFGASITPARAGAEPTRYLILAESGIARPALIVILYTELFFEMISLVIVAAAMLLVYRASRTAALTMAGVVGTYSATILSIAAAGVFLANARVGDAPPPWAQRVKLTGGRWAFVLRWVERVRSTVVAFRTMDVRWGVASCLASVVHVAVRFTILPMIVLTIAGPAVPLGPLVLWPFTLIYGANVMPAPGGGGAVELVFRASLGHAIPAPAFAAALVWWRFYTFYLYIALGALVAGRLTLRAIRQTADTEKPLARHA
ncbi:MAG TPA: lysylphosphatidylglycerol synthase domain-containing protein [Gemmatimonadaceae bacterium]